MTKTMPDGTELTGNVESTLGRFIFNEIIEQDLGFVDRSIPGNELKLEVDFHVGKKGLKQILEKVINTHGTTETAEVLDRHQSDRLQVLHPRGDDRIHFGYDCACAEERSDQRR